MLGWYSTLYEAFDHPSIGTKRTRLLKAKQSDWVTMNSHEGENSRMRKLKTARLLKLVILVMNSHK